MKRRFTAFIALTLVAGLLASAGAQAESDGASASAESYSAEAVATAQKALDYQEILNVAGKHEYYHTALRHEDELNDIWAQEADDISWTNNTQKYEGRDAVYGFYVTDLAANVESSLQSANAIDSSIEISDENLGAGMLWYHMMMTPVIEIAGDGQTAKGLWMSFGTVTGPMGEMSSQWTCETYGIDFIKENGAWKIWHLSTFVYFYCSTDGHWYKTGDNTAYSGDTTGKAPGGVGVTYDENGNQVTGFGSDTADAATGEASPDGETASGGQAPPNGDMTPPDGSAPEGTPPSDMTPPNGDMTPPDGSAPTGGADGASEGGSGYSATTPTETGTFFTAYSLFTTASAPEIPQPYETWADTFSY